MVSSNRSLVFRILYCWGKIVGLNPLNLSERNELEFSHFSVIYGCFLVAVHSYTFYLVFDDRLRSSAPYETPVAVIVFFIWISSQFLEILTTWFVFAVRQNRTKFIVASSIEASRIARELGIAHDHERGFRKLGASVAVTNFLYVITLAVTIRELSRYSNFNTALWIAYDMPRIAAVNMEILFAWSLDLVCNHFHGLNEKLRRLTCDDCRDEYYWYCRRKPLRRSSCSPTRLLGRITMISELHRRLRDLVRLIEKHFATLILFCIAAHFAHIAMNLYLIYRYVEIHLSTDGVDFMFMIPLVAWLLASVLVLAVISNVCGSTSNEANETGNILHAVQNDGNIFKKSVEIAKFNIFSLDLLKNRVSVSLFGFFELNYFFVFNALTTAAMYVVIMLQFYS